MKPFNEAVALVIKDDQSRILVVRRPNNPNDELAGLWGFPAVTLQPAEDHTAGGQRVGKQKLGVKIKLGKKLGESTHDRGSYSLHLTDYEAKIEDGEPRVPQSDTSVTQYSELMFTDDPNILIPTAKKGSQCTQIYLETLGIDWQK